MPIFFDDLMKIARKSTNPEFLNTLLVQVDIASGELCIDRNHPFIHNPNRGKIVVIRSAPPNAEKILQEMDLILDHLIQNANDLLAISQNVIAEEELESLQKLQTKLLNKLIEKDTLFHKTVHKSPDSSRSLIQRKIDQKLEKFQQLNAHFIDNITTTHGLIQFKPNFPSEGG